MTERIALITGGNKGLGFETARRLKSMGFRVYIGARESERGIEAASRLNAEWLQLDVTDEESVRDAAAQLSKRENRLDVLINNAGIAGTRKAAAELTGEDAESVFATNVVGPVRVMNAFIPLMETSTNPVIVNVSSGLGSFAITQDPQRFESQVRMPLYCASKSALTMLTLQYARALPNFHINAADPGYTATDLNAHRGQQTVEEGTDAIIRLATLPPDGPTGIFVDRHGLVLW
ncbi:SDR family NAD(P)-dependent oxidoreductase [Nguyenibacter sp. L1]|uniref:SDR family NAD(P)-dependent oxidoreductase n=1 Tax=Nguyenibacter sp. L1 TaxID=3049350 RepID=UPI002B474663|nr:SDR family NAD(P)-dependent oxidoreductase [Nguyenibacter sp. L1]WRH88671.1 SDR family NAD(P)-dependent oxidoreductase [Nguyenibacter sp. L1]